MHDSEQHGAIKPPAASFEKAVTFISYAREDKDFVLRLAEALQLKGLEVCGDWQLVRGENYQVQLHDLQLNADAIVFVTSPDSVRSGPCRAELDRAAEQKKRILPVVCRDLGRQEDDLPEPIRLPQWTHLRSQDDFVSGVQGLVEAISTDFDLMPEHRRLLQAAENWDRHQRSSSYLLRKDGLRRAEDWLAKTSLDPNKLPKPTPSQLEYIRCSRSARVRGARIMVVVVSVIAVAMATLAVVAFYQRGIAKRETANAVEQKAEALKQKGIAEEKTKVAEAQTKLAEQRRKEAEEATETERAARAVDLSQQPGREIDALTAAVLAAGNTIQGEKELPRPALIEGLAAAVAAARHSFSLRAHTGEVDSAAFSPDGTRLLSESKDCTAKLWDIRNGRLIASFPLDAYCDSLAHVSGASFSCDSRQVVTVCNHCGGWRNFLARIWDAQSGREVMALRGHTDRLTAAFFSRDSSQVVTASVDRTAKIWDAHTGQNSITLKVPSAQGPGGTVYYATFSPDGAQVLTAHQDNQSRLWKAHTGELLGTSKGGKDVPAAAFYPDSNGFLLGGRLLSVSVPGSQCAWRVAELSPDGKLIVTKDSHRPGLKDRQTEKPVNPLYGEFGGDREFHSGDINSAGFSPDGRFIVTASQDATARVWNAHTGEFLETLRGHADRVWYAAFAPDNRHIVTASADRTVRLWDTRVDSSRLTLGRQLEKVPISGYDGDVHSAAFSPDGKTVVTAHEDGFVRLWDAATGQAVAKLGASEPVYQAVFSPDGSRIVASAEAHTLLLNSQTKRLIATVEGNGRNGETQQFMDFSPNGDRFITITKEEWLLWDSRTGKLLQRGSTHDPKAVSFSPDGLYIAIVDNGGSYAEVLGLETHKSVAVVHNGRFDNFAVFSPDGLRVVTPFSPDEHRPTPANADRTVQVWDTKSGKLLSTLRGHLDKVLCAGFSHDGSRLVTGGEDHTARIWALSSAKMMLTLDHAGVVYSVTFSPDGSQVLTLSRDHEATLWDSNTGRRLAVLQGHIGSIHSAAFSQQGTRIVTASRDGTAKIFSADISELVETYLSTAFRLLRPQPEFQQVRQPELHLKSYLKAIKSHGTAPSARGTMTTH